MDGTKNKKGTISEKIVVMLETKGRKMRMELLVTGLEWKQVILGYPWLVALNPDIDWRKGTLQWRNNQPESSKKAQFVANIYALLFDQETKTEDIKEDDLVISYLQGEATDTTNEVWAKSKMTCSIALAQKEEAKKPKQKVKDLVPKALHEYLSVFSEQEASRFPKRTTWDHAINLKEGFKPKSSPIYPVSL